MNPLIITVGFFLMASGQLNAQKNSQKLNSNILPPSSSMIPLQEISTSLNQVITIEYFKAPIVQVLRALGESAGINMLFSQAVLQSNPLITIRLDRVTYNTALKAILDTYQLGYQVENNILKIDTLENIQKSLSSLNRTKEEMWLAQPTRVLTWTAKNMAASKLVEIAGPLLKAYEADERFTIQADDLTNKVMVEGIAEALVKAATIFESLDNATRRQVRIDARIVEANQSFSRNLGITWGASTQASGSNGLSTGLIFPNNIAANVAGAGEIGVERFLYNDGRAPNGVLKLSLGSLNGLVNLDAMIHAYETDRSAHLISSPSILVNDQASAKISESTSVDFPHTQDRKTFTHSIASELNLDVTPRILGDKTIQIAVKITRTVPNGQLYGTGGTTTHDATTELLVQSGETAVIGGLHSTAKLKGEMRIPILGSIPVIGWLFKNRLRDFSRNELLVLLTPQIIGPSADGSSDTWRSSSEKEELSNTLNMSNDSNMLLNNTNTSNSASPESSDSGSLNLQENTLNLPTEPESGASSGSSNELLINQNTGLNNSENSLNLNPAQPNEDLEEGNTLLL